MEPFYVYTVYQQAQSGGWIKVSEYYEEKEAIQRAKTVERTDWMRANRLGTKVIRTGPFR